MRPEAPGQARDGASRCRDWTGNDLRQFWPRRKVWCMKRMPAILTTERLVLRIWHQNDLDAFAEMHADPSVMRDQGGPLSFKESRAKLSRYVSMYEASGFSRYCVRDLDGAFVGYVGICPRDAGHGIESHSEIGWRLCRRAWGKGYATEAGRACIAEFIRLHPETQIISYTSGDNRRSRNVMTRLNMHRASSRDFQWRDPDGISYQMLVWVLGVSA